MRTNLMKRFLTASFGILVGLNAVASQDQDALKAKLVKVGSRILENKENKKVMHLFISEEKQSSIVAVEKESEIYFAKCDLSYLNCEQIGNSIPKNEKSLLNLESIFKENLSETFARYKDDIRFHEAGPRIFVAYMAIVPAFIVGAAGLNMATVLLDDLVLNQRIEKLAQRRPGFDMLLSASFLIVGGGLGGRHFNLFDC